MDINVIKTLQEISQNEPVKFKAFRDRLVEYCIEEKAVLDLFRVLKGIELELNDCLTGRVPVGVERAIIIKVLKTTRTELDIIRCKMKYPEMIYFTAAKKSLPVGKWTDDKVQLVELIYAIHNTKSVNNGNVTLKALQEGFEYIFQVKLGNISDKLREINERKGDKVRYLVILKKNLNNVIYQIK